MAARRLTATGGVIDAGYRGEVRVLMENLGDQAAEIHAGDKLVNLIPYPVLTTPVEVVQELAGSSRKAAGLDRAGGSRTVAKARMAIGGSAEADSSSFPNSMRAR